MNTDEKAKAYDKALSKAREYHFQGQAPDKLAELESIFPELRESEDERIRKSLVGYFEKFKPQDMWDERFSIGDVLTYLEKQKEQKPINNSTREKIISRATSEKQVVLISESSGKAEIGWDTRSLEDAKKLLEYGLAFINKNGIKPAEKPNYSGLTELERAIHRGFLSAGVENVPVTIIKETAKDCLSQINEPTYGE